MTDAARPQAAPERASHLHSTSPSESTLDGQDTMDHKHSSIFGSIKSKLSRKNSMYKTARSPTSPTTNRSPLPFGSAPSFPTRRPERPGMNAFTTPSNEPPPAYTPKPNTKPSAMPRPDATAVTSNSAALASATDDPYAFLSSFDTVFLIDDSGSMAGRSWRECSLALEAITPICTAHDADGIDIYFLNAPDRPFHHNVVDASTVHEIFSTVRPQGGTPTGQRLHAILKPYLRDLEAKGGENVKPLNVIVITDGVPSDDVESVLIAAARKLDRMEAEAWQVGVQFFQVGEEQGAAEHLQGLDDELSAMGQGCRDIVDTVPFVPGARGRGVGLTADAILKVVLGAVNRRLDRRQNSGVGAAAGLR